MKTRRPSSSVPLTIKALLVCIVFFQIRCQAKRSYNDQCPPSSCGNIRNISYPFRLETDPPNCGHKRYKLSCENNNKSTILHLFSGKYYVKAINYNNNTIRVVESSIYSNGNCSFIPQYYSLYHYNFTSVRRYGDVVYSSNVHIEGPPKPFPSEYYSLSEAITFLECENPVKSDPLYVPTIPCINSTSTANFAMTKSKEKHSYVKIGGTNASELKNYCRIELMTMTSWPGIRENRNISFIDIHSYLEYGFELLWFPHQCYVNASNNVINCASDQFPEHICDEWRLLTTPVSCGALTKIINFIEVCLDCVFYVVEPLTPWVLAKIALGTPFVIAFLIYKWRKRHLSMYAIIEVFLETNNNLMPIRYSYSDIRKMTKSFKDKLGEGGYGLVYKGKLRSGRLVAIKMLGKSKANGQDFINEVDTIGRIHHFNVVRLVGFCVEGSKRALVYDFMPNGSLDKYIFSQEGTKALDCKKMCEISYGVACGIEYLHRGCNMQIVHFDIKPHNILLDENFIPKVSDFGLAKLCPLGNSFVSLTGTRGTMGYMAPELFYKNIGGVSYKADVYSFGMLLMEMASRRKNLNAVAEHTSQVYFPSWVYDQINEGKDLEIEDAIGEESKIRKKMIIVALWCIQLKPSDRPSMNKVKEMLEGEVENLQMPPKPFLCPQEKHVDDDNDGDDGGGDGDDGEKSNSKCLTTPLDDDSEGISLNLDAN